MIGVGIFFQQESDGKVYAKTVVSGGSAERDGMYEIQFLKYDAEYKHNFFRAGTCW
jgi:hypothetical protein